MKKSNAVHKSGKRKRSIARATVKKGQGKVKINGVFLDNFGNDVSRLRIQEPLILAGELAKKINVGVSVRGGGVNGQADAIRLAIARALVEYDNKLKKVFEDYDRLLLVADIRRKEVCKPNISKARAKRQKSYR
ncbi:30S ribosomal protein S9 [Candidatus Woesearchaeota archaeon]|nr:30S ribosomal protein S9 [Candidatus Woesearchaeota archaeon]